jgi:hypothetical protein
VAASEFEQLRARYVEALDAVEQASERTVAALEGARAARKAAREVVLSGRPLVELEQVIALQPLRVSVSDALVALERARHDAQRLLFLLLRAEGQTLADIGRTYGISRQLVSRLVNEPDPERRG